jgi:hypothetical protein
MMLKMNPGPCTHIVLRLPDSTTRALLEDGADADEDANNRKPSADDVSSKNRVLLVLLLSIFPRDVAHFD